MEDDGVMVSGSGVHDAASGQAGAGPTEPEENSIGRLHRGICFGVLFAAPFWIALWFMVRAVV